MRRFIQIATVLVLLISATALAGDSGCASAQTLPTAAPVVVPVPTTPAAGTVALATDSSLWRTDLQQALLASAAQAVRQAGFTVSNPAGAGPTVVQVMPMGQTAVTVPTITLTVNVGMYTSSTFYVSRYSESVMVTATLVLPDTRMFRTTDNETASWFSTYIPLPYTYSSWMPFGGSTQVGTPQQPAEQRAAAQAAAKAVTALLSVLGPAPH